MASRIKRGEPLFIPFWDGHSVSDSQLKPRMYKTEKAFEKAFPVHYLGNVGVELVEYAEVVRCKDCKHYTPEEGGKPLCALHSIAVAHDDFCSYGERKDND